MTYAKEHFLVFRYLHGGVTQYLSIKKFSHTRWIGLILQAEKLVKLESGERCGGEGESDCLPQEYC